MHPAYNHTYMSEVENNIFFYLICNVCISLVLEGESSKLAPSRLSLVTSLLMWNHCPLLSYIGIPLLGVIFISKVTGLSTVDMALAPCLCQNFHLACGLGSTGIL